MPDIEIQPCTTQLFVMSQLGFQADSTTDFSGHVVWRRDGCAVMLPYRFEITTDEAVKRIILEARRQAKTELQTELKKTLGIRS